MAKALSGIAARHQQAQADLIAQMEVESGLPPSALAVEAGFGNSTVTRPLSKKRPMSIETLSSVVEAFLRFMSNKGLVASETVLRLIRRVGLGDDVSVADITPDRLMLAVYMANEDFKLDLSNPNDIRDLCNYVAELYPVIIEEEQRTGASIQNDESGRAALRRA